MNRVSILNALIAKHNYKSYLELGVRDGSCFNNINCDIKIGVDPDPSSAATHIITSDEYFAALFAKFDLIFVDALHHKENVIRDIENSLRHLNEEGTILVHDCLPTNEFMTLTPMRPEHNEWTGDVFRGWLHLRQTRPDLSMRVISTDWGCGIIQKGSQEILQLASTSPNTEISYQDFERNKAQWLPLISVEKFIEYYLR